MAGPEFTITPRGNSFSVQLDGVEAPATTFDAGNVLSWQGDPAADGKWIDGWSGKQRVSSGKADACMCPAPVFFLGPIAHMAAS